MIQPSQTWYASSVDREPDAEDERADRADDRRGCSPASRRGSTAPSRSGGRRCWRRRRRRPEDDERRDERERARDVEEEQPVGERHGARQPYAIAQTGTIDGSTQSARHLRLLTETIAAVNSSLDLEEVLGLIARRVADALEADACFVYLYDERADELVLRATHGTHVEELTRRPRMRPGEGITGTAAAERAPVMIAGAGAPRPALQVVPEPAARTSTSPSSRCRSSRATGGSKARSTSARSSRATFAQAEIDLLLAIATQVAQSIEHAQLYAQAQRRVARARVARADLGGGVGVALPRGVARGDREDDDGAPSARPGPRSSSRTARSRGPRAAPASYAVRLPLRWKRRQIGELVCDRDTPFTRRGAGAARVDRAPRRRRARARARRHARRPRPGDPPPRQEQPPDRRVAAPPPGARGRTSTRAGRSTTRSTGSSRSPRCTRC